MCGQRRAGIRAALFIGTLQTGIPITRIRVGNLDSEQVAPVHLLHPACKLLHIARRDHARGRNCIHVVRQGGIIRPLRNTRPAPCPLAGLLCRLSCVRCRLPAVQRRLFRLAPRCRTPLRCIAWRVSKERKVLVSSVPPPVSVVPVCRTSGTGLFYKSLPVSIIK